MRKSEQQFPVLIDLFSDLMLRKKSMPPQPSDHEYCELDRLGRGIPKVCYVSCPSIYQYKEGFKDLKVLQCHLESAQNLKRITQKLPSDRSMCLVTWVLYDGWGDYTAGERVFELLKEANIDVFWLVFLPDCYQHPEDSIDRRTILTYHKGQDPILSKEAEQKLKAVHLVLHCPVPCAFVERHSTYQKQRFLGEYGFIEAPRYHPGSGNFCMGLHPLEQGILLPKRSFFRNKTVKFNSFQLRKWCLEEELLTQNPVYLAYLSTPIGGRMFFETICQVYRDQEVTIDFCTPEIQWLIGYLGSSPVFEGGSLSIHTPEHTYSQKGPGKFHVRVFCVGRISKDDFYILLQQSEPFVGIRGNQSLSEVIALGKPFFYDGPLHTRYFVQDLVSLSQKYLLSFPACLSIFHGIEQLLLHQVESPEGDWSEPLFLKEKRSIPDVVDSMAKVLLDPELKDGFQELSRQIRKNHSCHAFVVEWVQQELAKIQIR